MSKHLKASIHPTVQPHLGIHGWSNPQAYEIPFVRKNPLIFLMVKAKSCQILLNPIKSQFCWLNPPFLPIDFRWFRCLNSPFLTPFLDLLASQRAAERRHRAFTAFRSCSSKSRSSSQRISSSVPTESLEYLYVLHAAKPYHMYMTVYVYIHILISTYVQ